MLSSCCVLLAPLPVPFHLVSPFSPFPLFRHLSRAPLYTRHLHRITTCWYHDLLAFVPVLSPSPLPACLLALSCSIPVALVLYLQPPRCLFSFVLLSQYMVPDLFLSRRHVLLCNLVQTYLQTESGLRHGKPLEQKTTQDTAPCGVLEDVLADLLAEGAVGVVPDRLSPLPGSKSVPMSGPPVIEIWERLRRGRSCMCGTESQWPRKPAR